MYLEVGEWRREFPTKYYEVYEMGYGYRAGNYIFDELINQINLLKKENERLKEENLELKKAATTSFSEVLKQGD